MLSAQGDDWNGSGSLPTERKTTRYTEKLVDQRNKLIIDSRQQFYKERISAAGQNTRRRWAAIRDVLHLTNTVDTRSPSECQTLCNKFALYFVDKIQKIKTAI